MSIEHVLITDPDIHETKGASSATTGQTLIATGSGSATWTDPNDAYPKVFGRSIITNDSTGIVLPTAVDGTLHTDGDYTDVSLEYTADFLQGITVNGTTNHFIVPITGAYSIDVWASISSTGTDNTTGVSVLINGTAIASTRPVLKTRLKTAGDIITVSGFGLMALNIGDELGLAFADDTGVTLTIHESVMGLELVRRT